MKRAPLENHDDERDEIAPGTDIAARRPGEDSVRMSRKRLAWPVGLGPIAAFAVLIVVFGLASPNIFLTVGNLVAIINTNALLVVLVCGLTVVLLAGEFDLSIGSMVSLSGALAAGLVSRTAMAIPVVIFVVSLGGAIVGTVNGVLVTRFKVPALIATLAVGSLLDGLTLWYTNGETITENIGSNFTDIARWSVAGIQGPAVYMVVIALLLWVGLRWTAAGRRLHAIGGNRHAGRMAGIRVDRHVVGAFAVSGLCGAIAGILLASRNASATPLFGQSFLLPAYAAAFLGSVTLRRKEFHVTGSIIGVYLVATGTSGFVILGAPAFVQQLFGGAVLLVATVGAGFSNGPRSGALRRWWSSRHQGAAGSE